MILNNLDEIYQEVLEELFIGILKIFYFLCVIYKTLMQTQF
jgi:hypothetical protein